MKQILGVLLISLACFSVAVAGDKVDFKLKSVGGDLVELSALCENGPVLISFWATFCEPCKKEIPHLIELLPEFEEQKLQLVLVSVDSPRSQKKVKPYVQGKGWEVPVLLDTNGKVMKQFKGKNPPYTMIVSAEGEVLYQHSGYKPGDEKELKKTLAELLGGGTDED